VTDGVGLEMVGEFPQMDLPTLLERNLMDKQLKKSPISMVIIYQVHLTEI
jgi:hypothetical protein